MAGFDKLSPRCTDRSRALSLSKRIVGATLVGARCLDWSYRTDGIYKMASSDLYTINKAFQL